MRHLHSIVVLTALALFVAAGTSVARQGEPPYSLTHPTKVGFNLAIEDLGSIDAAALLRDADRALRAPGMQVKRAQVAESLATAVAPTLQGRIDNLPDGSQLWRARVRVSGATDLRLGFDVFRLPTGASLHVIGADDYWQGPYTIADDNDGRFEAPVLPGDSAIIELHVPAGQSIEAGQLRLGVVGAGFRDVFGRSKIGQPGASGECNIDVVCDLGQPYADEIRAVAYIEFRNDDDGQYYMCSGTLLADVPRTRKNWFLTAGHCIDSAAEANSISVYWNYQSTRCQSLGMPTGGFFKDNQSGAWLRAARADVDFSLLELKEAPAAAWNVYRAGWDATNTTPSGTIGIHHPSGDVKKITAGPRPATIRNCTVYGGPANTHWQTGPYSQGTTEGGSSGSGLFAPAGAGDGARRLIGMLSGGNAQCSSSAPTRPDNGGDCYGKFAIAWDGASADQRLRDWLDPDHTGTRSIPGGTTAPAEPVSQRPPLDTPSILRQLPHRRATRP
ncbi:trypsin-like serine peptidase [Dokdonella sp.]|uniref:trypsin-like serine peptidase n=1 Tax=Dokdonella sp. TaxID=2291710 RepID=UPI0031C6AEB7|nr:hypothetical protein [Dokdonella sp.]